MLGEKFPTGATDVAGLSSALGTISPRMIRLHISTGELEPMDKSARFFVITTDKIADWLLKHPKYLFKKTAPRIEITQERYQQLSNIIRAQVKRSFSYLLNAMCMDDIVADVFYKICRSTAEWNAPDGLVIQRYLLKIARREAKRIHPTATDPSELEKVPDERS